MQLESITLTLNNQTRTFTSVDGQWFNATEISNSFGLPLPSRWRNQHSRYYDDLGQIRKVHGRQSEDTNLDLHFYQGVWMTRTALHAWAYSVDVDFSNKVILAFEAAADGRLEEATSIATSISNIVATKAGIYDNTITIREAISTLKGNGYISSTILMSNVFHRLVLAGIIEGGDKFYNRGPNAGDLFSEVRGNPTRLKVEHVPTLSSWINLNV